METQQHKKIALLPPLDEVSFWAGLSHNHLISSGLLVFSTLLALIIANSKYGTVYHQYLDMQLGIELGSVIFDSYALGSDQAN